MPQEIDLRTLSLKNLCEYDPTVEAVFQKIIRDLAHDCEMRPYEKKERKCKLIFCLEPVLDEFSGNLDYINVAVEGSRSMPKYRTKISQVRPDAKGNLRFNRDLPSDIDQRSLFTEDDDE